MPSWEFPVADISARAKAWAATMQGNLAEGHLVRAHADSHARFSPGTRLDRLAREDREAALLRPGATRAAGAGNRARAEAPDPDRTCFERDRDRVVHSPAFRRLAGKTQVVVYPRDHERTRLTHAIEVAQVATSIARTIGANVTLTDAIALAHDCGHGPGGHASEDAFDPYLPQGYDHGPWGADVTLAGLNLCAETLDGVRRHSWSNPAPATIEGEIVSWADRIAYCAHDLEDAVSAQIVKITDLPAEVTEVAGNQRRTQLATFINAVCQTVFDHGEVGMDRVTGSALAALRAFNYERIYTRPQSQEQSAAVIAVLRGLVDYYLEDPQRLPEPLPREATPTDQAVAAVAYVGGMTDRFAFTTARERLGWDPARLPRGIGRP